MSYAASWIVYMRLPSSGRGAGVFGEAAVRGVVGRAGGRAATGAGWLRVMLDVATLAGGVLATGALTTGALASGALAARTLAGGTLAGVAVTGAARSGDAVAVVTDAVHCRP